MVVDLAESLIPTLRQFITAKGEDRASLGSRVAELASDFDQELRWVNAETMGDLWLLGEGQPLAMGVRLHGSALSAVCEYIHIVVDQDHDGLHGAEILRGLEEVACEIAFLRARLEDLERTR